MAEPASRHRLPPAASGIASPTCRATFGPYDHAPILPSLGLSNLEGTNYPIFKPPGRHIGSNFTCQYTALVGWSSCFTADDRTCWLRNDVTRERYSIGTDYDNKTQTLFVIHRNYTIGITDEWLDTDGRNFSEAKLFNRSYPGPWIQGCWGDLCLQIVLTKHILCD